MYIAMNNLGERRFLRIYSKHTIRKADKFIFKVFTVLFIIMKNQKQPTLEVTREIAK